MRKLYIIVILAIIAFLNASFLTRKAFEIKGGDTSQTFCDISGSISCTNALSAPEARIGGVIPFPAIALIVYPILVAIALRGVNPRRSSAAYNILTYLSAAGILFNTYFIFTEALIIKAFCPLCLLCTAIIITIFILSLIGRSSKET